MREKKERRKTDEQDGGGVQSCTFLQVPGHLVAGRTDTEPAVRTDPVEVEDGGVTRVTDLPQPLNCSLPHWSHWRKEERYNCQ